MPAALRLLAAALLLTACGPASTFDGGLQGPIGGTPCGYRTCPSGQVCCNESCSICTPPGAACTQQVCSADGRKQCTHVQICQPGYAWDDALCRCVPSAPAPLACTTDADCRLLSSYCDGCDCVALTAIAADPVCHGRQVQCLVDPCQGRRPACMGGTCASVAAP